ncbi:hypothetical protein ACXO2Y_08465 [Lactobacillus delbrueckii subsp. bulgaricus]
MACTKPTTSLAMKPGDRMLIALASELAKSFGQDMSCRFGGDEFLAIALDERLDKVQAKRYFLT